MFAWVRDSGILGTIRPRRLRVKRVVVAPPPVALIGGWVVTGVALTGFAYFLPLLIVMRIHLLHEKVIEYGEALMAELVGRAAGGVHAGEGHANLKAVDRAVGALAGLSARVRAWRERRTSAAGSSSAPTDSMDPSSVRMQSSTGDHWFYAPPREGQRPAHAQASRVRPLRTRPVIMSTIRTKQRGPPHRAARIAYSLHPSNYGIISSSNGGTGGGPAPGRAPGRGRRCPGRPAAPG